MDDPLRAVLLAGAWLVGWWLCGRVRTIPAVTAGADRVSVVVPARDEEAALPTLLNGLGAQTLAPVEVLVVDDGSSDATAAVASAHGARVITSAALPAGWTGKAWALWQGAQAAREDVVVLLDADVVPGPDLLASVVAAHARRGGLVSVQPYHVVRRWWERASAFFNLVAVMGVGLGSPPWPPRRPIVAAFGPVIVCRRELFLRHGDLPRVRSSVVEDVELARSAAAAGEHVATYAGGRVAAFRMFDDPGALLEGWTKNFASGARAVPPVRLVFVIAWLAACLVSGAWLVGGSSVAVAVYAAYCLQCFLQLRQIGSFGPIAALVYPVLALVFVLVFLGSLVLVVRGEVRWKGRRISLGDR